jgi:hypothetical protein
VPADTKEKRLNGASGEPRSDEAGGKTNGEQKCGFLEPAGRSILPKSLR